MANKTSRRCFLKTTAAVGAAIGAGGLIAGRPGQAFAARPPKLEPIDGKVTLSVADHPELLEANSAFKVKIEGHGKALITHIEEGRYITVNTRCSHEGCHVKWAPDVTNYQCPCHDSSFDTSGAPLGGPAVETGPLKSYETSFEEGVVTIAVGEPNADAGGDE